MKIIGNIVGILLGYVLIGFFACGFINLLQSDKAHTALIFVEGFLYFISAVIYTVLTIYQYRHSRDKDNSDVKKRKKALIAIYLISFLIPIVPVLGLQLVSQHTEIFFVFFLVLLLARLIPIFVRQFKGEIDIFDAKIKAIKCILIIMLIMIISFYICKYFNLPIINWKL